MCVCVCVRIPQVRGHPANDLAKAAFLEVGAVYSIFCTCMYVCVCIYRKYDFIQPMTFDTLVYGWNTHKHHTHTHTLLTCLARIHTSTHVHTHTHTHCSSIFLSHSHTHTHNTNTHTCTCRR
jgi:hypothetical protein